MKFLKAVAPLIAAVAWMGSLAEVDSASATVLCVTNTAPCSQKLPVGVEVRSDAPNETSSTWTTEEGFVLDTCTGGRFDFQVTTTGSATETVHGAVPFVEGLTWVNCTSTADTLEKGEVEIHWIAESRDGTITATGLKVSVNNWLWGTCVFSAGSGTDLGKIVGGSSPSIVISAWMTKVSGSCPGSAAKWTATKVLTEPTPLYVEPS